MKKAVSTLACDKWSLEKTLEVCGACKIDALEIRMGLHEWSRLNLSDEEYAWIGKKITEAGLCVCDLGTSVAVKDGSEENLKELERCAQIAQILNCRGLRVMFGSSRANRNDGRSINPAGIIRWIKKADILMAEYGTEMWIETHNEFSSGHLLSHLISRSRAQNCRLVWDIMHTLEAGETAEETYSVVKPYLAHVHIKDGKPWSEEDPSRYHYTRLGEGTVDMAGTVRMLQNGGYRGYYSLEWEGVWRKELRGEGYEPEKAIASFSRLMDTLQQNS
jgi:sugar phosphate isomerase/epimerase